MINFVLILFILIIDNETTTLRIVHKFRNILIIGLKPNEANRLSQCRFKKFSLPSPRLYYHIMYDLILQF